MKKTICLVIALTLAFSIAGCSEKPVSPNTGEPGNISTEADLSHSMPVDELLTIVNTALENDAENKVSFNKDEAQVLDAPQDNEIIYVFEKSYVEIALIVNRETGIFKEAFFRIMQETNLVRTYMASFAGVFLMALEPNEYARMLEAVVPILDIDEDLYINENEEEHDHAEIDEGVNCLGEFWTVFYHDVVMNIRCV